MANEIVLEKKKRNNKKHEITREDCSNKIKAALNKLKEHAKLTMNLINSLDKAALVDVNFTTVEDSLKLLKEFSAASDARKDVKGINDVLINRARTRFAEIVK